MGWGRRRRPPASGLGPGLGRRRSRLPGSPGRLRRWGLGSCGARGTAAAAAARSGAGITSPSLALAGAVVCRVCGGSGGRCRAFASGVGWSPWLVVAPRSSSIRANALLLLLRRAMSTLVVGSSGCFAAIVVSAEAWPPSSLLRRMLGRQLLCCSVLDG